jgi:dsRNA-specific ribonuclease
LFNSAVLRFLHPFFLYSLLYPDGSQPSLTDVAVVTMSPDVLMRQELSLPRPPVSAVLEALTSKGTNEVFDYERYETLGDAVLKLIASVDVFLTRPDATEGQLSAYK